MEIRKLSGGKTLGVLQVPSVIPEDLDPARLRVGHPGKLDGNTGVGLLISEAAKLKHGVPAVDRVRIIFREIQDEKLLLIVPAVADGPDTYKLGFKRKAPQVAGLKKLFRDGAVPLRQDLWYWLTPEIVEDEHEGFAVAGNWTKATVEPRDISKERKLRAEADKRRREKRKQEKQTGETGSASKGA